MRLIQLQMFDQAHEVFHCLHLGISTDIARDIRRWVTSGVVGDDPVAPREVAYLRLPTAEVASKFMAENQRVTAAGLFIVKLNATNRCFGHTPHLLFAACVV